MCDDILVERLVEAIRFDVDYHLTGGRAWPATQGTFNKEFTDRIKNAQDKNKTVFHKDLRKRVFGALLMKGTVENHMLFDTAVEEFKKRVNRYRPNLISLNENNKV